MKTEEMLQRAKIVTPNSACVIDSRFKINQWDIPFFAGLYPNASGLDILIFIMLCNDYNENGQVGTTLSLILRINYISYIESIIFEIP